MMLRLHNRLERGERGAVAILMALLMVVLLAVAALAVDTTTHVNQFQTFRDTIDAAAQAGASMLPGPGTAATGAAKTSWENNDPTLIGATVPPTSAFLCVVASLAAGVPGVVDTTQIPATCNPASRKVAGTPPTYTGSRCNGQVCSIPCFPASGDVCNSVTVTGTKPVPYAFAPAIGIKQGSTGSVSSTACKGPCGTVPQNPMDVAVVADRTASMSSAEVTGMIGGIKGMLQVMTPSQQYVALGTIGRSKLSPARTTCTGSPLGSTYKASSEPAATGATTGPWIPEAFANDYLVTPLPTPPTPPTINTGSTLVNAIECLRNQNTGTSLASPMKAAARYLLGPSAPYDPTTAYPAPAPRTGTVRKAIIFETDGEPYEVNTTSSAASNATLLTNSTDVFSKYTDVNRVGSKWYYNGGDVACQNLLDVAKTAKDAGILVVTVGYNLSGVDCDHSDQPQDTSGGTDCSRVDKACDFPSPRLVSNVLAGAASEKSPGVPSAADNNCSDLAANGGRDKENSDGDNFFCAAASSSSTDMAAIFKTAFTQINSQIRLIQLP